MLTFLWASKHGLSFIKTGFFRFIYLQNSARNCIKLKEAPSLKLYHSITKTRKFPQFVIPREDYTVIKDVAKGNYMITGLFQEGKVSEAQELFDEMPERDVISWTALISGYTQCGLVDEARVLLDKVDADKNVVTWTVMLSGYLKAKRIFEAEKLFDEMPEKNVVSWNTMIDGYIKSGRIEQALGLFKKMEERNVVSWNMMISGLVNCGRVEEGKMFFSQMPMRNVISWTIMVSGLARNGMVDEARLLFDMMPQRNVVSWNAMITGYGQNMKLDEAYHLFKVMPEKDLQSWNAMITGFIQNGELEKARRLFNEMPRKNIVSWTAMISGMTQYHDSEEALKLFISMKRNTCVKPNESTFVSVLRACSDLAGLGEGMQIHQMISKTSYQESEFIISAIINMYAKCGELATARRMFYDGSRGFRDLVSWNSMIAAYGHHGCGREAIMVFDEMQEMGFKPNDVTYIGLLSACSHAGLVQEGLDYFNRLLTDESVKLREEHYTVVVDLYGRAGRLNEAFDLIEHWLPVNASPCAWGALLLGCKIHGNADLGKLVGDKVMDLELENAGIYVLLSNIYASNGKLKEAESVKMKMKKVGLKKEPGCSWIEVGHKFHVFVVGDGFHRENEPIHALLFYLHKEMGKIGFSQLDTGLMKDAFMDDFVLI